MSKKMVNQRGFTLLELMIVMAIIGILIGPLMSAFTANVEQKRADVAIGEITDLYSAAQTFAANNTGSWPGQAASCQNAIALLKSPAQGYLVGFRDVSVYGTTYTTSCPVVGAGSRRFTVSLNVNNAETARLLAGSLPSTTVAGTVITSSIPLPAEIPAFDLLLPRSGERPMTGDLDMGSNNITAVNDIHLEGTSWRGKNPKASEAIYFAGIVNPNTNERFPKPICPSGSPAIPIVVPAGNAPTAAGGELSSNPSAQPEANPIGADYAWADDFGDSWVFRYKMAVYKNNNWDLDHRPGANSNFLAVYVKCFAG